MIFHPATCPFCFDCINLADGIDNLCQLFIWGALKTWKDLDDSHRFRAGISEDSITDILLLEMRRRTRHLVYRRHTRHEEHKKTGADWLWWFVSGTRGFPVLVQAKRLYSSGRYESLKYKRGLRSDQTNTLLGHAKQNGWLPLFCFYNYWYRSATWPNGPNEYKRPHWGCTVASAQSVKRLLLRQGTAGNLLKVLGPISIPWMCMVCPTVATDNELNRNGFPDDIRARLARALNLRNIPEVAEQVPSDILQMLYEPAKGDHADAALKELDFLRGLIIVSDQPIEREY